MAFAEIKWDDLIGEISGLSTLIIVAAFAFHVFMFFVLWIWAKRDLRAIATSLYDFTRRLKNQSLLEQRAHLSVQIEAFIADVNDVLDDPSRQEDRKTLLDRMRVLDEKRRYLNSMFFETVYNITRTMIEAYPLAGVLGTILAIGAALEVDAGNQAVSVSTIVGRFGEAIWSTFGRSGRSGAAHVPQQYGRDRVRTADRESASRSRNDRPSKTRTLDSHVGEAGHAGQDR